MRPDFFAGMRTPRPPDDLKGRVLRAARAAVHDISAGRAPRWGFNRLDLVWTTALLALVLCHAVFLLSRGEASRLSATPQAVTEARQLEDELGLPGALVVAGWRGGSEKDPTQRQLIHELERL